MRVTIQLTQVAAGCSQVVIPHLKTLWPGGWDGGWGTEGVGSWADMSLPSSGTPEFR